MNANENTLNTFTSRVRQMNLQYQEVKKENTQLQSIIEQRDKEIQDFKQNSLKRKSTTISSKRPE